MISSQLDQKQLDAAARLSKLSLHDSASSDRGDSYAPCSAAPSCAPLPATAAKAQHAKKAFGDLLDVLSPMQLVAGENPDAEAEYWSIFADVFEREVQYQEKLQGQELDVNQRRQILADILVWAEVTQSQYDNDTASFVTEPHEQDASFRRIGDMLKAAKAERGLCR